MPMIALARSQGEAVAAVSITLTREMAQGLQQIYTWTRLGGRLGVGAHVVSVTSVQLNLDRHNEALALGEMRIAEVRLAHQLTASEWSDGELRPGSQRRITRAWCFVSDQGVRWTLTTPPAAEGEPIDVWVCPLMPWAIVDAQRDAEPLGDLPVVIPHAADATLAIIAKPPAPGRRPAPITIDDESIWAADFAHVVNDAFQRRRHRPDVPGSCPTCGMLPATLDEAHLSCRRVLGVDGAGVLRLGEELPRDTDAPPVFVLAFCEVCSMRYLPPPGVRVDARKGRS